MKALRLLLWITGVLIALAVGAVVVLATLVDANDYKPAITEWVEQNTGRKVALRGDIELEFFPWIGVTTGPLELANRAGFASTPMVAVDNAAIRIKVLPLLNKRVEVDTVLLTRPQIRLSRRADGVTNWDDLLAKTRRHGGSADGKSPDASSDVPLDAIRLAGLSVQGVSIEDGWVDWDDRTSGERLTLSALNLDTGNLAPGESVAVGLSMAMDGNVLPESATVTLTTTVQLAENLELVSLNDTDLRVGMETITADLSVEQIAYSMPTGRAIFAGLRGNADHHGINTRLEIPALNFNMADESLQVPSLKIVQGDASVSASLNGAGVMSGVAEMIVDGDFEARADDVAGLLARNDIKIPSRLALDKPMTVNFRFNLANRHLTLIDLEAKSEDRHGEPWSVKQKTVTIPLAPDGSIDESSVAFVIESLLKERIRKDMNDLKESLGKKLKKKLKHKLRKALGIE